jgi:hypothetical protein
VKLEFQHVPSSEGSSNPQIALHFRSVTGSAPPPTTQITVADYAEHGYPYFEIYDEKPFGIKGEFEDVRSVNDLDKRGKPTKRKNEAVTEVRNRTDNAVVLLDHKGNRVGFRTVTDIEKAVRGQFGELAI